MKYRIMLVVILLFYLLLLPLVPAAHAAERWEDGWNAAINYEFDAATGTVTLSGTGEITVNTSYKPWGNYPRDVKKVVIGEGITGIGAHAFSSLRNLTEVVLPKSLTSIGRCAFQSCDALTTIDISHVTSIAEYAFNNCLVLAVVDIRSVTSLGDYAFQRCALRSVIIPEAITVIPRGAFMNCSDLREVILHDQITKIGYSSFQNCYRLTSLRMPKGLKEMDDLSFANCTSLTDIQLNEGLEIISHGALSGCKALKKLVIPDSVNKIENNVFMDCTSLQSIHFGSGISNVSYTTLMNCSNLTTITVSDNNPHLEILNNGLYTKEPRKLVIIIPGYAGACVIPEGTVSIGVWACNEGKITSLTIPNTVKIIDEYAFWSCKNLKTVSLGSGVEEIKTKAFMLSGITELTLPANLKKLGDGAFHYCSNLTKITFEGLPPTVENDAFGEMDIVAYYPGYMKEWKDAEIKKKDFYLNYTPDCHDRHDLRWEVIKAPTCKETGWRSETWCIVCRKTVDPEGELPLADHSYGAWTTVNAPTAEKEGLSKRTCKTCGAFEQKTIPKLDSSATPPATEPSSPATSEPSAENPTDSPVTSPSTPEETQPATSSDLIPTEPAKQEDSSPALWLSVVTIAVASILIGMVTSLVIFALKKQKK